LAESSALTALTSLTVLTTLAAAIATAHHPASLTAAGVKLSCHNFLNQRFHCRPLCVICESKAIPRTVHHALLHCRRVKIASATAATAAAAVTIAVVLRQNVADAQGQSSNNCA
jgi:hypothetical protein